MDFPKTPVFGQSTQTALESPKIDICQNGPQGALGDVSSCLETKFDKKMSMGSVPNCRKEIADHDPIRWFKCKLKPPKKEYAGEDNNNLDCRRLTLTTNTNNTNKEKSRMNTTGQPEPCRANDVRSLPDQGWLGQGGFRRLQKGLKDMAGQFTTCGRGDKEVLPSQQGGLGQGQVPKPDEVIGHSDVESMTCGHSGIESMTCLSVSHSGIESMTCGHSGVESMTCSVDGQSGAESLTSPTVEVGVDGQCPAKVRARKETQWIPVRAECIAGSRRVLKQRTAQIERDAGTKKVRRVQDPVGEVETAEGAPELEPAEGAPTNTDQIQDVSGADTPVGSDAELQ